MAETAELEVIANETDVEHMFSSLANQIVQHLERKGVKGYEVSVVAIKNGGVEVAKKIAGYLDKTPYFMREKILTLDVKTIDNSLYKDDGSFSPTKGGTELTREDVDSKYIILIDEITATTRTVRAAMNQIMDFGRCRAISLVSLMNIPDERVLPTVPDFIGVSYFGEIDLGNQRIKYKDSKLVREKIGSTATR